VERRSHPRHPTKAKLRWSAPPAEGPRIDDIADVSVRGARIVTPNPAPPGTEIRLDVLDEAGELVGSGLGRVLWTDARGMGIAFLSLGIDPAIVTALAASGRRGPPPLRPGAPPPMPVQVDELAVEVEEDDELTPIVEPLPFRKSGYVIGIDLGTTNTCASYVVDGKPKIIPGRTGTNTIPSMITFDPDGTFYVGQRAADRQILHPTRTVYGSKRLVGRTYRAELAAELQQRFAYPLAEAEGQRFGVRIDHRVVSMDTIAARILDEVRSTAEEFLKAPVAAAVITVPAYFTEVQREAVLRAANEANLVVHRIVNEPTAAAVAYGHKQLGLKARIAVWDFGGGTFDFSVVDVADGQLDVVATGGDNFVGGTDFDDALASFLMSEFQRVERVDRDPSPQQIARLREAAEGAKRGLSSEDEVTVAIPDFADGGRSLRITVTRDTFDELTRPLVDRAVAIAREVMAAKSVAPSAVTEVILVGGTSRIPAVQHAVATLFGRRPSRRINPDEAVALGAGLLADEIGSGTALHDVLPMSVGFGVPGLRAVPILERNARLPAERELTLDADPLGQVSLPLFQGEAPDIRKNEYLCTVIVEDRSLWDRGRVNVKVSFDEHCVMAVEAKNARTGRPLPARLDRSRSLDEILAELGSYVGPEVAEWKPPTSLLGRVLGRLFRRAR
jgi:molecular chaperone DnaK